jgi:hypothetical protein
VPEIEAMRAAVVGFLEGYAKEKRFKARIRS